MIGPRRTTGTPTGTPTGRAIGRAARRATGPERTIAAIALATIAAAAVVPVPAGATSPPVKTLDDIRIEGEIRLPRVLFITSRDSERPLDFLEHYRASGAEPAPAGEPLPVIGKIPPLPGDDVSAETSSSAIGAARSSPTPPATSSPSLPAGAAEVPASRPAAVIDAPKEVD